MQFGKPVFVTIATLILFMTGQTWAKTPHLVNQLKQCQVIAKDSKRLACFDRIANKASSSSAPLKKAHEKLVKEKPVKTTLPKSKMLDTDKAFGMEQKFIAEQAPDKIVAKVVKITKTPRGQLKITLDNGQVWKQTSSHKLRLKTGESVIINRGIMSAFRLQKMNSNRSYDVKRVK